MKPSPYEVMKLCVEAYCFGIHVYETPTYWKRNARNLEYKIYSLKSDLFWKARMRSLYSIGAEEYTSTLATFLLPPATGDYYSKIYRLREHPTQQPLDPAERDALRDKIVRLEFSAIGPIATCKDEARVDPQLFSKICATMEAHDLYYISYLEMQKKIESPFLHEPDQSKTWYDVLFRSE